MSSSQPSFTTARLELHPATASDIAALHALWSDEQVRRFLFDDQPVSLELAKSVLDECLARASEGLGLWLVYERQGEVQEKTLLGCVGINPATVAAEYEPALRGLLEPIAAFAPDHWNKGYAQESVRPLLAYAFGPLNQSRIVAVNDVPNIASERMLLRLGFTSLSEVQGPHYRIRTYQLDRGAVEHHGG